MQIFSSLITVLIVIATCTTAKRKAQHHRKSGNKAREEIEGNPIRDESRDEEHRNVTKLYDTVHKYRGKERKDSSAKRHYLGSMNGLESILSNSKHQNGLNGLPTAEVGVHADDPNAAYLDVAHGVTAAVHAQKLQVGTQPQNAHSPADDGLNPLPIFHHHNPAALAGHSVPSTVFLHGQQAQLPGISGNVGIDHTVATPHDGASIVDSLHHPEGAVSFHDGASIADSLHHPEGAVSFHDGASIVDSLHHPEGVAAFHGGASIVDSLHHPEGAAILSHLHDQDASMVANHIHDQGYNIHEIANAQGGYINTASQAGDYLHQTPEIQHELANQAPFEITRPPIHIRKEHHRNSYETVQDEGEVMYHPCLNGGVYVSTGFHSYECICPEQYIGKNCQDVNHCNPCPCKNKGRCHNIADLPKYKCTCPAGFYGPQCENKNPCHPNPCKNNGVCSHDGKGNVECVCTSRFKGDKCEDLHNCKPNPCQNDGACVELEGKGKFECQCTNQWRGTVCNKPRFCYQNPCQNLGTCQENHDTFNCICNHGFRGRICEDRACRPNPCKNGGTCSETEDGKDFKCVCLPWHGGRLCEENRPCLTNPCMNGGKCIDSYSGFHWAYGPLQFYCICKPPYQGERCEVHGCRNCHKNAHCEVDKCVCDEGYKGNGKICIKKEDPCHPNPCQNDGICVQRGDTSEYDCQCKKPYLPPNCKAEDPCDPNPCKNEGQCTANQDGSYTCTCPSGTRGVDCQTIDPCLTNPCQHGGTCRDENGTAVCECKGAWAKPFCKECSCVSNKNSKGPAVTCDAEGKCVCPPKYDLDPMTNECIGDEIGGGACQSNPCLNEGTCIEVGTKDYTCNCKTGYIGKNCQIKDPCNPNPCKNGGTCNQDKTNLGKFLSCTCPKGFTVQPFCDKDKPLGGPCTPNPCKNDGTCTPNGNSYDCNCKIRYTGPTCNVDKCANCDPNAACVNGRCKCKAGFIGNGYECIKDIPTCAQKCPQYSTCVIPTGNCQCNQGYTFVDQICLPIGDESEEAPTETTDPNPTDKPHSTIPTGAPSSPNPPLTTASPATTPARTTSGTGAPGGKTSPTANPTAPATTAEVNVNHPGIKTTSKPRTAGPPASSGKAPTSAPNKSPGPPSSSGGSSPGTSGPPGSSPGPPGSSPGPPGSPAKGSGGPPGSPSGSGGAPGTSSVSSTGGSTGSPSSPAKGSGGPPGSSPSPPSGSGGAPGTSSGSSTGGSTGSPSSPAKGSGGPPGSSPSPPSGSGGAPSSSKSPASPGSSPGGAPSSPGSVKSFIRRKSLKKLSRHLPSALRDSDSEFDHYRR